MSIINRFDKLIEWMHEEKGKQQQSKNTLKRAEKRAEKLHKHINASIKAHAFIQNVAQETQSQIKTNLVDIASFAMAAVFPDPYKLMVDFVPRRNKIEVDMWFERRGIKIVNPLRGAGLGATDVAALSLMFTGILLLKQTGNPVRPLLLMDEPLHWLKGADYPEKGAEIIRTISQRFGIQVIMVNHHPKLTEAADRVFKIRKTKKQISKVEVIK
jgi:hypothetical protein